MLRDAVAVFVITLFAAPIGRTGFIGNKSYTRRVGGSKIKADLRNDVVSPVFLSVIRRSPEYRSSNLRLCICFM